MKIHFIGIGGIGMSALADVSLSKGDSVTGSDLRPNNLTQMLREKGALVHKGHSAGNLDADTDLVVKSTCIRDDNSEVLKAKELGLKIISRGAFLEEVMTSFPQSVGVTGTHGKTTTSSIIAHVADSCGLDPTVLLGGEVERFGKNARSGEGKIIIAEVDESDGTFRNIGSTCAVITNIEREHMEHYSSMEEVISSYKEFASGISKGGLLVYNGDDELLRELVSESEVRKVSFGFGEENIYTFSDLEYKNGISFDLVFRGKEEGRIASSLIGKHNCMNILAAIAVCMELGMLFSDIASGIKTFLGVKRRFELIARIGGIQVIEDYAHHPTELKAIIEAAKDYTDGRVIAIFQPHRYSRTQDLLDEFSKCFTSSDVFILTDIYSADENMIEGLDVKDLFERIDKSVFESSYLEEKTKIPALVAGLVKPFDIVLVLGAGDIREISSVIGERIREKFPD